MVSRAQTNDEEQIMTGRPIHVRFEAHAAEYIQVSLLTCNSPAKGAGLC